MIDLLREYWDWFLFDTLLWTGALIALVMLLRRPVARHLGAGAAYALWFLPLARLIVPPFTLPGWMKPFSAATEQSEAAPAFAADAVVWPVAEPGMEGPTLVTAPEPAVDFLTPLLVLWLVGAMVMLTRRFWLYFQLRRELLDDAKPVGEVGTIRLIETSAITGPMAFGVMDRVIALPSGFMTSRNRTQRDLAIEHELAHHRGGDLLVNMAVQPLFAIHWFNPLGWLGWHALRRDQEAFCDARVVAARPQDERAAYAGIIADYARLSVHAPRPALAAPMACPVLGDKSIIHRLRSLSMSDISPRRRLAGRAAIATTFLAVPLTATICYAEAAPVALVSTAQAAEVDEWTEAEVQQEQQEWAEEEAETEADFAEAQRDLEEAQRDLEEARRDVAEAAREVHEARVRDVHSEEWSNASFNRDAYADGRRQWAEGRIQYAEGRKQWAEGRVQWAHGRKAWAEEREARATARATAHEAVQQSVAIAFASVPEVIEKCVDPVTPITTVEKPGGKTVMYVCEKAGEAMALDAVRMARRAIAADRTLDAETREEILRDLDAEITELQRGI